MRRARLGFLKGNNMNGKKGKRQVASISLPQSLKERMRAMGHVNWSRACRDAIEAQLKFEEALAETFEKCGMSPNAPIELTPGNISQVAAAVCRLAEIMKQHNHE